MKILHIIKLHRFPSLSAPLVDSQSTGSNFPNLSLWCLVGLNTHSQFASSLWVLCVACSAIIVSWEHFVTVSVPCPVYKFDCWAHMSATLTLWAGTYGPAGVLYHSAPLHSLSHSSGFDLSRLPTSLFISPLISLSYSPSAHFGLTENDPQH